MIIGYVRNQRKPGNMATKVAELCKEEGIDLIYFTPKSLNRKTGKVNGKILLNNGWNKTVVDLPSIIDISPLCGRHKKQIEYLQKHCLLTDNTKSLLTKESIYEMLAEHEVLEPITVPTKKIDTYKDILDYIRDYETVNIQAFFKKDITENYVIYYQDREVFVLEDGEWNAYGLPEFENWYRDISNQKTYIVQKHIESKTPTNIPFEFRVSLDKNGDNDWEITQITTNLFGEHDDLARLNSENPIELIDFLNKHYDTDIADRIEKQFQQYSFLFAKESEQFRNQNLMMIGIDFGVTNDGNLFVIDANNSPSTLDIEDVVAPKRVAFYKYLIESYDEAKLN